MCTAVWRRRVVPQNVKAYATMLIGIMAKADGLALIEVDSVSARWKEKA